MQFSGMFRHPLRVACEIANFVPHPGIRIERQAANWNPGNEIAGSGKKHTHQAVVLGEEENIAHQAADGVRGRQLIDAVLRTLLQEKQNGDGGCAVFAGLGQFPGERSAVRRVTVGAARAQVGNLIGEQSDVRWRQPRNGGFAGARYA